MKLSRRGLFPLTAAGVVGAASQTKGSELDEQGCLVLKLQWNTKHPGWNVLVPRFGPYSTIGHHPYLESMRLDEYLAEVERGMKAAEVGRMARPKKAAPQWPIGGEPKALPAVEVAKSEDGGKTWAAPTRLLVTIRSLADAVAEVGRLFPEPPTRGKAHDAIEVMSGGRRSDGDFPALYLTEAIAAKAWLDEMLKVAVAHDDDRLIWVEYPELIKLQITIMDMRDRTHRVGNDRYVARSKHAVVKAVKEAA